MSDHHLRGILPEGLPEGISESLRKGLERAAADGRIVSVSSVKLPPGSTVMSPPVQTIQLPRPSAEPAKPVRGGGIDRRRPPAPAPDVSSSVSISITVRGVKLRSEANAGGRLGNKLNRKDHVKEATWQALERLGKALFPLPVDVRLIRHGRQKLDAHDNLPMAFKSVADVVADWLGIKDNDSRVRWSYDQEAEWFDGMTIEIRERTSEI